jgi:hypothetical protein
MSGWREDVWLEGELVAEKNTLGYDDGQFLYS